MSKKEKVKNNTNNVFLCFCGVILLFIVILVYRSLFFLATVFEGVSFQLAVYQITSPLKGTGGEILDLYISSCIIWTIVATFAIIFIPFVLGLIFDNEKWIWSVRIFEKKFNIILDLKQNVIGNRVYFFIIFVAFLTLAAQKAVDVGVLDYVGQLSNSSTLFEEYYVGPDDVTIEFPTERRNLLLIYMESMEATYADVSSGGGKKDNYIPNLTKLALDNACFSNTENEFGGLNNFGLAGWTMASLLASSSGVPYLLPVEGNSMEKYDSFLPGLKTIGEIFNAAGYDNYFFCGSDATFGGRELFYRTHGNYTICDYLTAQKEGVITPDYYNNFWGMEDKYLYEYLERKISEVSESGHPFNMTVLTVDTHHPEGYICDLCEDNYPERYGNAIACADKQIISFLEWAKTQEWYENTSIVIVGDHTSMNTTFWEDVNKDYKRSVYNCFINVPLDMTNVKFTSRQMSQLDLFPTILASVGVKIEGNRLGLGTNLFSNVPTLEEELGTEQFYNEATTYSQYYNNVFIKGK